VNRNRLVSLVALAVVASAVAPALASTPVAAQGDTVTMTVTVQDQQGNNISGATVTASWDDGATDGRTAGNGKVFLDVPRGTQVQLTVEHPGYIRNQPVVVASATEQGYTVPVFRRGSLRLALEDSSGPLSQARVIVRKDDFTVLDRTSNAQGVVDAGSVEYGNYTVTVMKPGYPRTRETVTVDGTVEETLRIDSASVAVEFVLRDDHFQPPRPVPDATVVLNDDSARATTLSNGRVEASVPVNTEVTYVVRKEGYRERSGSFRVGEEPRTVNLTVQRIPALTLETSNERIVVGESVTVTVRNQYDEPVAGVTVTRDGETVGETDTNGQLRMPVESGGEHTIAAQRGQAAAQTTVEGVEGATATPTPTTSASTAEEPEAENPLGVSTPGFGPAAAALALLALALLARRRE
jgi:PGF-CTERM protein